MLGGSRRGLAGYVVVRSGGVRIDVLAHELESMRAWYSCPVLGVQLGTCSSRRRVPMTRAARRRAAARATLDLVALAVAALDALPGPAGATVAVTAAPGTWAQLARVAEAVTH